MNEIVFNFMLAVMTGVIIELISYFICKWLDRCTKHGDNSQEKN